MRTPFDIETTPLDTGVTLLEASAGTGKTFTIEGLYLRLVAERGIPIREILVCTFTNAATEELRLRIRERLRAARDELRADTVEDPAVRAALREAGDAMVVRVRIAQALSGFDEARIFTIHGFCNRVLSEHAFESGGTFDRALADDSAHFATLAARDFSRRMSGRAPFAMLCLHMNGVRLDEECAGALMKRGADRDMELRPLPTSADDADALEANLQTLVDSLREVWHGEAAQVMAFVRDESKTKADLRGAADMIERAMTDFADGAPISGEVMKAFAALRTSNVADQVKKRVLPPDLVIFRLSGDILSCLDSVRTTLVRSFMLEADALVGDLRAKSDTMGYDDLLYETAAALRGTGAASLAEVLRSRFRVALVDEFQDTDRLQWEIFRTVFAADSSRSLYLIGDPKQSIYSFRGADVHAYMAAAASAESSRTLDTNWRSDAALVNAVNAVFTVRSKPFGMNGIEFFPAVPSGRIDDSRAFSPGPELPREPMRFVVCAEPDKSETAFTKEQWLMANLCGDVRALLDRGATIGPRAVNGSDIAVIVRTHDQAAIVKTALAVVGVQAVEETGESVFDSDEAGAFADFLAAMLATDDPRLARWALAGEFFGMDAAALAALRDDDAAWESWVERLTRFRAMWEKRGIMPAFRMLDVETDLRARIAGLPDGERILTNLLHLSELLNAAEKTGKLTPAALQKWLSLMRLDASARPKDGHETRLESDAKAVRIITAHKSKGLEFPVVFMPFALEGARRRNSRFIVAREHGKPVLWIARDDAIPDEVKDECSNEELCERIRLLYVSLTRARNRCVVYLSGDGVDKGAAEMALPSVLGASDWNDVTAKLNECRMRLPDCIAVETRNCLPVLAGTPPPAASIDLSCRTFSRRIENIPMLTSFSALHGDSPHRSAPEAVVELPERLDAPAAAAPVETELQGMAAFPRGTAVGTFFHACLEEMDYADPASWREVVEKKLKQAGLSADNWLDTALAGLADTLDTPLALGGPLLAGKPKTDLVREGEFYFPAHGVDVVKLAKAFAGADGPLAAYAKEVAAMDARAVDGYLKGYIDLVFRDGARYCILDWKSNWLGDDVAAYTSAALDAAMRQNAYYLQGCLYAVALRRSMAARWPEWDYERHFGGIYYVFLRGIDKGQPGHGVTYFRPDESLLNGIEDAFGIKEAAK
jgi:exodeoxyribonuclease V beta subunit